MGASSVVGKRIAAALIDFVLLLALFIVYGIAFGDTDTSGGGARVNVTGLPFLGYLALVVLYFALLEGTSGRTLGKRLLGLRVVTDEGATPTLGRAVLRNLLRLIDWLPFAYIVGLVSVVATGERAKRLGDLAARTTVVAA